VLDVLTQFIAVPCDGSREQRKPSSLEPVTATTVRGHLRPDNRRHMTAQMPFSFASSGLTGILSR